MPLSKEDWRRLSSRTNAARFADDPAHRHAVAAIAESVLAELHTFWRPSRSPGLRLRVRSTTRSAGQVPHRFRGRGRSAIIAPTPRCGAVDSHRAGSSGQGTLLA